MGKEEDKLEKLRPYSITMRAFEKILGDYPKAIWYRTDAYESILANYDVLKEKGAIKDGDATDIEMKSLIEGMNFILLQDDQTRVLFGIYLKGVELSKLKTVGGYMFSEVVAKKVGIYNPLRNQIGRR